MNAPIRPRRRPFPQAARRGFTLVEVLIVVMILGILASVIIAQVSNVSESSRQTGFASQVKAFVQLEGVYRLRSGLYLANSASGVCPPELLGSLPREAWEGGTPVGGVWDAEFNSSGITSGIGVHFDGSGNTRDDAYMVEVDRLMDDGDLATGAFRKLAGDRYYWVIAN